MEWWGQTSHVFVTGFRRKVENRSECNGALSECMNRLLAICVFSGVQPHVWNG